MDTMAKDKLVKDLAKKISHEDNHNGGFNIDHMIQEQENFLKSIRDYADTAWINELVKVYEIISHEICARAEFGDIYKMTFDCQTHFEPDPINPKTSTPTKLYEPLHLKHD